MKILWITPFLMTFAACAHHKHVRPGEGGLNHVVIRSSDRDGAERKAIKEANHFCAESNKHPVFIHEKTNYTGSMDEKDRETLKNASTAAMMIGGMDSPLRSAGTAGYIMTGGNDYSTEMKFKCE